MAVVTETCYGCNGTLMMEVHCPTNWRECEDGPGYHLHYEDCQVCGKKGTITYDAETLEMKPHG